jgi:hypothetical protein
MDEPPRATAESHGVAAHASRAALGRGLRRAVAHPARSRPVIRGRAHRETPRPRPGEPTTGTRPRFLTTQGKRISTRTLGKGPDRAQPQRDHAGHPPPEPAGEANLHWRHTRLMRTPRSLPVRW